MGVRSSLSLFVVLVTAASACGRTEKQAPMSSSGGTPSDSGGAPNEPAGEPVKLCAVSLAARDTRFCAVDQDGGVWCWGAESDRGPRDFEASATPVQLDLPPMKSVTLGPRHACAFNEANEVWCWGDNDHGQLGSPATTEPRLVHTSELPIQSLGLGETQSCYADLLGHTYCWGEDRDGVRSDFHQVEVTKSLLATFPSGSLLAVNEQGRAFDASRWELGEPQRYLGSNNLWVGVGGPTCVVKKTGSFWCSSYDLEPASSALFAKSALTENVAYAGVGEMFACALTIDGRVWCEGFNVTGQLGRGTTSTFEAGDYVTSMRDVRDVAVGRAGVCALARDGSVQCWGAYAKGQRSSEPVTIASCRAQSVEPIFRTLPRPSDDTRRARLAEAGKARGQAACYCGFPDATSQDFVNCTAAADSTPSPLCLAALEPVDAGSGWDCRADQLWEEADCLQSASCKDGFPDVSCGQPECYGGTKHPNIARYCTIRPSCEAASPGAEAFAHGLSVPTTEQLCDGYVDCLDGSDELNCTPGAAIFHCLAGGDVDSTTVCDGVSDCADGSDEACQ